MPNWFILVKNLSARDHFTAAFFNMKPKFLGVSGQTYVPRAVVLSEHEALIERLAALLCVEGRLVQHHAALLPRGHFVAEGALAPKGQHGG